MSGKHRECEFAYQFRDEPRPHLCRLPEGHEGNHECRTCGLVWTRSVSPTLLRNPWANLTGGPK